MGFLQHRHGGDFPAKGWCYCSYTARKITPVERLFITTTIFSTVSFGFFERFSSLWNFHAKVVPNNLHAKEYLCPKWETLWKAFGFCVLLFQTWYLSIFLYKHIFKFLKSYPKKCANCDILNLKYHILDVFIHLIGIISQFSDVHAHFTHHQWAKHGLMLPKTE